MYTDAILKENGHLVRKFDVLPNHNVKEKICLLWYLFKGLADKNSTNFMIFILMWTNVFNTMLYMIFR